MRTTALIAEGAKVKAAGGLQVSAVQGVLLTVAEFRAVQIESHSAGVLEALGRFEQLLTTQDHSFARRWGQGWLHVARLVREARGDEE